LKGVSDPVFGHAIGKSGDTERGVGGGGTVQRLFLLPGFTLTLYRLGFNASWQLRSSIWTKEEIDLNDPKVYEPTNPRNRPIGRTHGKTHYG
jgi:hypothetical protein